jgi:hypothetical protein
MEEKTSPSKTNSKTVPSVDAPQKKDAEVEVSSIPTDSSTNNGATLVTVPLSFKLASIILVSAIGFGSSWSGGVTGAMKTNTQKGKISNPCPFGILHI